MRVLLQVVSQVVLSALALIIADLVQPGFSLHLTGFFLALAVFVVAHVILGPFVLQIANRYAPAISGGVGLVATFLALWVATLVSGGITISDVSTWVLTPIIVWVVTALGGWIFMGLFAERWLKRREAARAAARADHRHRGA